MTHQPECKCARLDVVPSVGWLEEMRKLCDCCRRYDLRSLLSEADKSEVTETTTTATKTGSSRSSSPLRSSPRSSSPLRSPPPSSSPRRGGSRQGKDRTDKQGKNGMEQGATLAPDFAKEPLIPNSNRRHALQMAVANAEQRRLDFGLMYATKDDEFRRLKKQMRRFRNHRLVTHAGMGEVLDHLVRQTELQHLKESRDCLDVRQDMKKDESEASTKVPVLRKHFKEAMKRMKTKRLERARNSMLRKSEVLQSTRHEIQIENVVVIASPQTRDDDAATEETERTSESDDEEEGDRSLSGLTEKNGDLLRNERFNSIVRVP